ncbi:MAG: hypothetical protein OK457_00665 [Thaumarchaeota archaeon]|nr:hypothetical protein [Nitrososphaerota archaeon]
MKANDSFRHRQFGIGIVTLAWADESFLVHFGNDDFERVFTAAGREEPLRVGRKERD